MIRPAHSLPTPAGRRAIVALVTAVFAGAGSACATAPPIVQLEAPAADATSEERDAAWCSLKLADRRAGAEVTWVGSLTLREDEGGILGDGRPVTDVETLGGPLHSHTPTARALKLREDAWDTSGLIIGLGTAVGAGVLGGMTWSLVEEHPDGALWGWAVGGGLLAVLVATGIRTRMQAGEHLAEAWIQYNKSLERSLYGQDGRAPACEGDSALPGAAEAAADRAAEPRRWQALTWDLDVDFNLGRIWAGRDRAAFTSRVRAGLAYITAPWVLAVGPTLTVSNVTAVQVGLELEASHLPSGLWGELAGFADVHDRFGARVGAGWSIVGTELMLRVDRRRKASVGWFLKIRVPISLFVALAD